MNWVGSKSAAYKAYIEHHNAITMRRNAFVENSADAWEQQSEPIYKFSPCNSRLISIVSIPSKKHISQIIDSSEAAFNVWKSVPAPKRGETIRKFSEILRREKDNLASVISMETGKTINESCGEVQEMIDICDYAVGLSRQLTGLTIASERSEHRLLETWHPLGPVAVITAFNFPAAVWAWNFALAIVCGNSVIWKPSEKTPCTAIICNELFNQISPVENLSTLVVGRKEEAEQLVNNKKISLVSATGSTEMGRSVALNVQKRFGKFLLELGGNNAGIVTPSADLHTAIPSIVFAATGTAGQRCTTLRRLFVHDSIYEAVVIKLVHAYENVVFSKIGNPMRRNTLVGPLIDSHAWKSMKSAIDSTLSLDGGKLLVGGTMHYEALDGSEEPTEAANDINEDWCYSADEGSLSYYVKPAIIEVGRHARTINTETFAPILYVSRYHTLTEAIARQNAVSQGLSSCIFTTDIREAELFLSERGSDCGIANVNIGTSGAEIGGAFGGEKETGGGRESGSDSWKSYMRRQTATINFSYSRPELAQGIKFD